MSTVLLYRLNGGDFQTYESDQDDPQVAQQDLVDETLNEQPAAAEWLLEMETMEAEPRHWSHTHLGIMT